MSKQYFKTFLKQNAPGVSNSRPYILVFTSALIFETIIWLQQLFTVKNSNVFAHMAGSAARFWQRTSQSSTYFFTNFNFRDAVGVFDYDLQLPLNPQLFFSLRSLDNFTEFRLSLISGLFICLSVLLIGTALKIRIRTCLAASVLLKMVTTTYMPHTWFRNYFDTTLLLQFSLLYFLCVGFANSASLIESWKTHLRLFGIPVVLTWMFIGSPLWVVAWTIPLFVLFVSVFFDARVWTSKFQQPFLRASLLINGLLSCIVLVGWFLYFYVVASGSAGAQLTQLSSKSELLSRAPGAEAWWFTSVGKDLQVSGLLKQCYQLSLPIATLLWYIIGRRRSIGQQTTGTVFAPLMIIALALYSSVYFAAAQRGYEIGPQPEYIAPVLGPFAALSFVQLAAWVGTKLKIGNWSETLVIFAVVIASVLRLVSLGDNVDTRGGNLHPVSPKAFVEIEHSTQLLAEQLNRTKRQGLHRVLVSTSDLSSESDYLRDWLEISGFAVFNPRHQRMDPFSQAFINRFMRYQNKQYDRTNDVFDNLTPIGLQLAGIQYIVERNYLNSNLTLDPPVTGASVIASEGGFALWSIPSVNSLGWSPTEYVYQESLADTFKNISSATFDPEKTTVINENRFPKLQLIPAQGINFKASDYILNLAAESSGDSLVVLPVAFSNCLEVSGFNRQEVQLLRVNGAFLGVLFSGQISIEISARVVPWGYKQCLQEDRHDWKQLGAGF